MKLSEKWMWCILEIKPGLFRCNRTTIFLHCAWQQPSIHFTYTQTWWAESREDWQISRRNSSDLLGCQSSWECSWGFRGSSRCRSSMAASRCWSPRPRSVCSKRERCRGSIRCWKVRRCTRRTSPRTAQVPSTLDNLARGRTLMHQVKAHCSISPI